jgi:hypothetical protein
MERRELAASGHDRPKKPENFSCPAFAAKSRKSLNGSLSSAVKRPECGR